MEIAKEIGIARSTLYNELKRGTVEQMDSEWKTCHVYFHDAGQRVYEEHHKNSRNSLKFAKVYAFLQYAEEQMLHQKLSPDAVADEQGWKRNLKKQSAPKHSITTLTKAF